MKSIPLSNSTIERRISDLSEDLEDQLLDKIKTSKFFALQLDESCDVSSKEILVCFVRYTDFKGEDMGEEFLCSIELHSYTTGSEIFQGIDKYMFPMLSEFIETTPELDTTSTLKVIVDHLDSLSKAFKDYFPDDPRKGNLWIINPFLTHENALTLAEEEKLIELSSDLRLKALFGTVSVPKFWIHVRLEYPELYTKAMKFLLPFSKTYLCEAAFSAMTLIKTKQRNRLQIDHALRMAVSNLQPRIEKIINSKVQQSSH